MEAGRRHVVVVEAYQGIIEFLSDDPAELTAARGLGLPLGELADELGCRFTVLTWDDWRRDESRWGSPFTWEHVAATRPVATPALPGPPPDLGRAVSFRPVPAREPDRGLPLQEIKDSPRTLGLIADNDLLVLLSRCLELELARLFRDDPFGAVLVPLWGGLGHLPQVARAAGTAGFDAPFAVVVTDPSVHRQKGNEEGLWTRPAQVRRQAEEMSLALADLALTFGPRGCAFARAGRAAESRPPVRVPRRVDPGVLDRISAAAEHPSSTGPLRPFLDEPQDGASGVLATLDAVRLLAERWLSFGAPVACAGPDMLFAPMKPRSFEDYWSSRAWVRDLRVSGLWDWTRGRPGGGGLPLRLWPSRFEHLPDVWSELARGSAVLLSPAAAEGFAPGVELPVEVLLGGEPTPERLADRLSDLLLLGWDQVDCARRDLCRIAAEAHRGEAPRGLLRDAVAALDGLLRTSSAPDLGAASLLLLDRTRPLSEVKTEMKTEVKASAVSAPPPPSPSLSVVLTCYDLGPYIGEAVESVWASERVPEEVLLVDDGSRDEATRARLADLEREAAARGLPLTVLHQGNRGLPAARNAGLAAAHGDFISFLDGDDLIEPPFYRLAVDLMTRHPRLGGVAGWSLCFGPEGPVGFWNPPHPELPLLFVENCVFVPCLTRTELLRRLGGYDTRQRYNYEDWELSVRLLAAGWPIVTIPAFLARYRVRSDSLLRTLTPVQNQVMRERLLETHRETAARFGLEIALQVEHRWKTLEASAKRPSAPKPLWKRTARRVLSLAPRTWKGVR